MPNRSDDALRAAYDAVKTHGSFFAASRATRRDRNALTTQFYEALTRFDLPDPRAQRDAAAKGALGFKPVLPGFTIKSASAKTESGEWIKQVREPGEEFEVPAGHKVKGVSALVDPDNRVLAQWVKTGSAPPDPKEYAAALEQAFSEFRPTAPRAPAPKSAVEDLLVLFPWADPHFGALTWRGDTPESWDLKKAVATFKSVFARVIERSPAAKSAILLVGGDTLHADSSDNMTPTSKNVLQVDGRHPKVFITACETIAAIADLLLRKFERVEVIVLGGNHDITSAPPIAYFLHAWFRNEPRVAVDVSVQPFRFRQFGKCHFGFTHGHTIKPGQMAEIMAQYDAKTWGATEFRFAHTFHVHHKSKVASEGGGCISETHQILAPSDAWHFAKGLSAARPLQSITYSPTKGECGRTIEML